jgi:hypothetical protein
MKGGREGGEEEGVRRREGEKKGYVREWREARER